MFAKIIPSPIGFFYAEASASGITQIRLLIFPDGLYERTNPALEAFSRSVEAYFAGEPQTFLDVPLDYSGLPPERIALYERVRRVPYGTTTSYGALGKELILSARSVGAGMRACPFFPVVPAQRVIHADGRLGGFMGNEGIKLQLLRLEGAPLRSPV
jgi:methylated-DNA-[protein]-cysteine S-methyltransferase